jgi:hypothetical protein
MMARSVVFGGFAMVLRGLGMVFGRFGVMFRSLLRHWISSSARMILRHLNSRLPLSLLPESPIPPKSRWIGSVPARCMPQHGLCAQKQVSALIRSGSVGPLQCDARALTEPASMSTGASGDDGPPRIIEGKE